MDKNFYQSYFELERDNWWFRVRRNFIFRLLNKYAVHKKAKIFDYGCGSGFLVSELQKTGWDAHGADIYPEAIAYGKARGTLHLEEAAPDRINALDGSFDVVLALDVLEHLKTETQIVGELERILKPGGFMIIMVPAFMFMWGLQDEVAHHYRRYRLPQLIQTLNTSGNFLVLQKTYFNTFLFPAIAGVRVLSKALGLKGRKSDFDMTRGFVNSLLFFIFNLELSMLTRINFPFGVSILAVLKKNV